MNKTNWYKIAVFSAIAIALFFLGRSCGVKSVLKINKIDTVYHKDSGEVRYKPMPYKVVDIDTFYLKSKPYAVHDTILGQPRYVIQPVDSEQILRRFYQVAYYDTTIQLRSGTVQIKDTVTQNRITGRYLKATGVDTTITKTEILVQPKRNVGYLTGSVMGNRHDLLAGAGLGLAWKFKNETVIGLQGKVIINNRPMAEATIMLPIRLRKN